MRAVIQRVSSAKVSTNKEEISNIGRGLVVLLGIEAHDDTDDIRWLTEKICSLRIFSDKHGLMNKSLLDLDGEMMLISQFTLFASTKKGRRPSFLKAAKPDLALPLYQKTIESFEEIMNKEISVGRFGADMDVSLVNDGPVTIIIDSKNKE